MKRCRQRLSWVHIRLSIFFFSNLSRRRSGRFSYLDIEHMLLLTTIKDFEKLEPKTWNFQFFKHIWDLPLWSLIWVIKWKGKVTYFKIIKIKLLKLEFIIWTISTPWDKKNSWICLTQSRSPQLNCRPWGAFKVAVAAVTFTGVEAVVDVILSWILSGPRRALQWVTAVHSGSDAWILDEKSNESKNR